MASQLRKQATAIQTMPNISRNKHNQSMKFGQLIDYNTKNFFLKSHTYNLVVKLLPDTFLKKSKLSVSLDQQSEVL